MHITKYSLLVIVASVIVYSSNPIFANAQCLSISSDLSRGMTDTTSAGQIMSLQKYLARAGFLSATPTGYFGAATVAAVKNFQSANGIPSTGYVGPLTEALINKMTCNIGGSSVQATVSPSVPIVQSSIITAPKGGQTLTAGQSFNITWNSQPFARYNIILMASSGSGAGFIAQSIGNVNQYLWTVGNVYSSQSQSNVVVPNGSYQIQIQNAVTGSTPSDPITQPFMISPATLSVSSVFPASVTADGNTAVVLYGSGFDSSASVVFSGNGARGQILYTSHDGKVLVFSVPVGTFAGSQSVSVTNSSGQNSNQLSFTIINP